MLVVKVVRAAISWNRLYMATSTTYIPTVNGLTCSAVKVGSVTPRPVRVHECAAVGRPNTPATILVSILVELLRSALVTVAPVVDLMTSISHWAGS